VGFLVINSSVIISKDTSKTLPKRGARKKSRKERERKEKDLYQLLYRLLQSKKKAQLGQTNYSWRSRKLFREIQTVEDLGKHQSPQKHFIMMKASVLLALPFTLAQAMGSSLSGLWTTVPLPDPGFREKICDEVSILQFIR